MERNAFLIGKKIHRYILPGVLMTVAMQLGNVVDGMIVGNLLGAEAMAAIEISMPVLLLLQMAAFMLAMGGAAEAAVFLGKREMEKAGGVFTASLAAGLAIAVFLALLAPILPGPAAMLLAGNNELAALAEPYIMVNVAGIPILTAAIIFCYFMNADNHPQLGSTLFIIANVVNLILDFVFIRGFHMGMAGSALATVIGYLAGMVPVVFYFCSGQRMLRLRKPDKKVLQYVWISMKAGIPGTAFTLMSALKSVIINSAIVRILGKDSMAVYFVCANAALITELCVGGIIGPVRNIAGILYGERDYYGIRTLCKRVLIYSYMAIVILLMIFFAVPGLIARLFGITEGNMLALCEMALRTFACSFPFYVYNKFLMSYYQTILQPGLSTVVTVLQGFVVIVPLTLEGIFFWGLSGVCMMAVVSEVITILMAALWRVMGQCSGKFAAGDMLPQITNEKFLECSVDRNPEEVIAFREKLFAFCADNHISEWDATVLGLAVEEIAANIVRYGYRSGKNYMDISFTIQDDKYMLRIRDDGIPFNPLEYQQQKEETVALGGIALIKKMASEFRYMRVLNMNNTVVELNIRKNQDLSLN
ncbi:hypothetical protein C823_002147 [Eubacterium plexicaudatum ASF492]|uniref:Histidine kinase/HSP90-like ATPase domain-containing protein n=1 Tax=Eubacterium plexicaudatum ASF492 TaxID=1235802 RepID=N2BM79_9FIRM|nr:hypothetical protein C823_002147 [Eubacterium plexicaudatum ASF492]